MEVVWVKLGFECMFMVDLIKKSGGLALLWKETDLPDIQKISRRHIRGRGVNAVTVSG